MAVLKYLLFALLWLAVSSVSVTTGRFIRNPMIAYPVAAILSVLVFGVVVLLLALVEAFGILGTIRDLPRPDIAG
ncbi:hypothetical protein [Actibacterium sp. 188UL27-1]|uniref:hypothetical protein n=1 Tax=Actibacterium sp. 188UL27-1 TaxID=2786961 RepID=UPI00195D5A86|nr:hypothetical protein [Actibacterium sp. 188UL27-1]MBM7067763.1 hypothetical protein [Actibacterium sp. 188UL27-1]